MKRAVAAAARGMRAGHGGPFGAVIVKGGRVVATACNTVLRDQDATCHAEINAIREASRRLGTFDLSGTVLYSTTEPCPMCFSAIHWARIPVVYYGSTIADVARRGFNEMKISNAALRRAGGSRVRSRGGVGRAACLRLLGEWDLRPDRTVY